MPNALLLPLVLTLLLVSATHAESSSSVKLHEALHASQIVYLGESHTNASDHQGQLEVLQHLVEFEDRPLIVLAEMLTERTETEPGFWETTDIEPKIWMREWGHPYQLYQSIFRFLREREIPTLWLRPDPAVTTQVRERGPAAAVPRIDQVLLGPKSYRDAMAEVAQVHLPDGTQASDELIDRYFTIQCFWDEFMAWRICQLAESHPEARIAVLVGYGHLHPARGIPWRVQRRSPHLKQLNIAFDREFLKQSDLLYVPGLP